MAIAGQCSSCYYTSPTLQLQLQLHQRHGHPPQLPQAARRARWPRLQMAAAAGGSIKADTDAEFFQPSDTRPIMLFDGANPRLCSLSARVFGNQIKSHNLPTALLCCVQASATSATGASGSCGSTTPTGIAALLNSLKRQQRFNR